MKRREFIKGVVLSAVTSPCTAIGGAFYEGSVLGAESPLAGVVVTDGLCCVLTDRQGRFRLPLRSPARFISVTVPSGWRTDRHYHRVSDGAFDFHLERWAPSARKGCSFVQLTDSETTKLDWVPRLKDVAEREEAAFVVHTGDIANKDGMAAHAQGLTAQTVGRPVYYCIGNHDLSGKARGESDFENLFGPCWYSFDAGGVHFVVTPMDQGTTSRRIRPK